MEHSFPRIIEPQPESGPTSHHLDGYHWPSPHCPSCDGCFDMTKVIQTVESNFFIIIVSIHGRRAKGSRCQSMCLEAGKAAVAFISGPYTAMQVIGGPPSRYTGALPSESVGTGITHCSQCCMADSFDTASQHK